MRSIQDIANDPFASVLGTFRGDAERNRMNIAPSDADLLWVKDKDQLHEGKAEYALIRLKKQMHEGEFFEAASLLNEGHKRHELTSDDIKDFSYIQDVLKSMIFHHQTVKITQIQGFLNSVLSDLFEGARPPRGLSPDSMLDVYKSIKINFESYSYSLAAHRVAKGLLQSNAKSFWDAAAMRTLFVSYFGTHLGNNSDAVLKQLHYSEENIGKQEWSDIAGDYYDTCISSGQERGAARMREGIRIAHERAQDKGLYDTRPSFFKLDQS